MYAWATLALTTSVLGSEVIQESDEDRDQASMYMPEGWEEGGVVGIG